MKRWTIYVVVVFVLALGGNWLYRELAPYQSGPLADVTWTVNGKPRFVKIFLEDEQGKPLIATLLTVYTDDHNYDLATNVDGIAMTECDGDVLVGIQSEHHTIFSKSLAQITGRPSLANGLDIKIVAKRPDLIAAPQDYGFLNQPSAEEKMRQLQKEREAARQGAAAADESAAPSDSAEAPDSADSTEQSSPDDTKVPLEDPSKTAPLGVPGQ